jgi:uncharacterized protein
MNTVIFRDFFRGLRYRFQKIMRLKASPHSIALGLAIGIFCGALPIMGIQSIAAAPLALLFRANIPASLLGVWWTNPVTFIPIYYLEYLLGGFFIPGGGMGYQEFYGRFSQLSDLEGIGDLGLDLFLPMTYGSIPLGIFLGALSYGSMFKILERRKARLEARRAKFKPTE